MTMATVPGRKSAAGVTVARFEGPGTGQGQEREASPRRSVLRMRVMVVAELRIDYEVHGRTTVVALRGTVDAEGTRQLRDAVDAARNLRRDGPIVVDLHAVDRLAPQAAVSLLKEARDSADSKRPVTVRGL